MLPMGWNQVRQARLSGHQPMQQNVMGQHQQQHFNPHPQMNPHGMMGPSPHGQPFDMYPQHQFMQQQQPQMFQNRMMNPFQMGNPMNPQQVMVPQKPPEPKGPPPPSPGPPLPKEEPQPKPPTVEAKWWVAEMKNLSPVHRSELERLSHETWFHTMSTGQQIECWQHKMQLISKKRGIPPAVTAKIKREPSDRIDPAPPVSNPSPARKMNAVQSSDVEGDLQKARKEEAGIREQVSTFERQYGEWKKQFDDWKEKHKAHPNKEQFAQYENQWMTWQKQMADQKKQYDDNLQDVQRRIAGLQQIKAQRGHYQRPAGGDANQQMTPQNRHAEEEFPFGQDQGHRGSEYESDPNQYSRFGNEQNQGRSYDQEAGHGQYDGNYGQDADFGANEGADFNQDQRQHQENWPRFPARSGMNNASFQNSPRGAGPRHRQPGPGWGNDMHGQRPRFPGHRPRFEGVGHRGGRGGHPAYGGENLSNSNSQDYTEEHEEYSEDQGKNFENQEWAVRGPRPRFRGRGGLMPRPRPPGHHGERFSGPGQRPKMRGRGFENNQMRGSRPRFPGPSQRFPGPQGPRPSAPNFRQSDNYGGDEAFAEDNYEAEDSFTSFEEKKTENDGNGNDQNAYSSSQRDWNADGSKFRSDEGKRHSSIGEESTNRRADVKDQDFSDVPAEDDYSHYMKESAHPSESRGRGRGALGVRQHGRGRGRGRDGTFNNRFDHAGESQEGYGHGGPAKPPHMLMKEAIRMTREKLPGRKTATDDRVRIQGQPSVQSSEADLKKFDSLPTRRRDSGATATSGAATSAIDSDAILQKAKELSNVDIKNLLSAVKSLKNASTDPQSSKDSGGLPSGDTSHTHTVKPAPRGARRHSGAGKRRDLADELLEERYGRNLSTMIDSIDPLNGQFSEAELLAAGVDPMTLQLRDEDLLLQDYFMGDPLLRERAADPMLRERATRLRGRDPLMRERNIDPLMRDPMFDPLLRDPYLQREMLLREMEERETVRRETELRQKLARPVLQAQKIVETIDYSHGLSKSKDDEGKDKDSNQEDDRERRSERGRESASRDERGPYDSRRPEREPYSPGRDGPPQFARERYPDHRMRGLGPDVQPGQFREMGRGRPRSPPRYRPEDLSNLVVVEEDIIRERESMERHRNSIDRERKSMEQRREHLENLDRSRNSREREEERSRRERSLERLQRMERDLLERERILNERERRLRSPPQRRFEREDWMPEGPNARRDQRRRFEEERGQRFRPEEERQGRSPDRGEAGRDRQRGWRRSGSPGPQRRDFERGRRDFRRSPDMGRGRPFPGRDRRRFTSPSGDPSRTGSPSRGRPPPQKVMKLDAVMIRVEDLLNDPARQKRPKRIVILLRGLPGSGKSHVAKLIRDHETSRGVTPRVLGLDDYFMVENEKFVKDPDTGKIVKRKVHEYEFEEAMEPAYRDSLLRAYRKTLEDGFFTFVIVDSVNDKTAYFSEFWTVAKKMSFEVYVAELTADAHVCAKRNIHQRKLQDIQKIAEGWEKTPAHMIRLDVRQMLQDSEIQEVEMGDISDEDTGAQGGEKLTVEQMAGVPQSKWELMETNARLDKLDGIKKKKQKSSQQDMADYLSVADDYEQRASEPGKKRVRWADIEEKHSQRRMREVGFVVGRTDWSRMLDGDSHADKALNQTKFI